jgi:hypothetical protein
MVTPPSYFAFGITAHHAFNDCTDSLIAGAEQPQRSGEPLRSIASSKDGG